jgi:hypothetical protein
MVSEGFVVILVFWDVSQANRHISGISPAIVFSVLLIVILVYAPPSHTPVAIYIASAYSSIIWNVYPMEDFFQHVKYIDSLFWCMPLRLEETA